MYPAALLNAKTRPSGTQRHLHTACGLIPRILAVAPSPPASVIAFLIASMNTIINCKLASCQPAGYQPAVCLRYKMGMETIASRIKELISEESAYEVSRKLSKIGVSVSPQAVYKWLDGGEISEDNLQALCRVYSGSPAWVRYGIGDKAKINEKQKAAADLVQELPPQFRQMTFDFLEYQLTRADPPLAKEKFVRYMTLIEKLKNDMGKKKQ